ncbi:MAG: stage II sporulation protein D [Clostridia bacterium]|nr:stage II sporulation protein D [Clostridia bacterium]
MKKLLYYSFLMTIVVVILPFLIVRGCSIENKETEEKNFPEIQQTGLKIKVYNSADDKVSEMPLEQYVKGVVAAEMPAEFGIEALKAQAVAARTYAVGRAKGLYKTEDKAHENADICTNSAHCQAWTDKKTAAKKWGILNTYRYWSKIERAVNETNGLILVYEDRIINPVFHANSGGKTENSEDVWEGKKEPYLRSVTSSGEVGAKDYRSELIITVDDFYDTLKKQYPELKVSKKNLPVNIKILGHTEGGRVRNLQIGNITVKGTSFRSLYGLKSANFEIEEKGKDTLKITVTGHGHGVGMSQWGADYLAKSGGNFEEILKYYYTGVELQKIGK